MNHRGPVGKIGSLPKMLRDQVSQMMQDNVPYKEIIKKLGEHGMDVNRKNIFIWKKGGHQEWLAEQQRLTDMQAKREFALAAAKATPVENLHETAMQLAAAQLYEVITDFDLGGLKNLLAEKPAEYNAIVTSLARLGKTHLDFEKHRAHLDEQKRKIESELGKARTDDCITLETIEKIEEALNLM